MPMIRARYPKDWDSIAFQVKAEAQWCCEQCCRPCRRPDESVEEFLKRCQPWRMGFTPADYQAAPRRWLLTVAHLDQQPENCERENLKALCVVCHLRHDRQFRSKQQHLKREWFGQMNWLLADDLY